MAESADTVARTGMVGARAVVDGDIDLRGYPHHLLTVVSDRGIGGQQVAAAVAAAEVLCRTGWELVAMFPYGQGNSVYGVLQRRRL